MVKKNIKELNHFARLDNMPEYTTSGFNKVYCILMKVLNVLESG